jgi:hypothetical protein
VVTVPKTKRQPILVTASDACCRLNCRLPAGPVLTLGILADQAGPWAHGPTVAHAIEPGAVIADHQPQENVRVLHDPAGHPFCRYVDE